MSLGDFLGLPIALRACSAAGSKERKAEGGEGSQAVQMYSEEVILKCDGAAAAVVDLHDCLHCFREVNSCLSLLCRRSGCKRGYPKAVFKKKKKIDQSMRTAV